jgi:hypothetical protein
MTDDEFDYWCKQQQLTAQTLLLIAAIRAAPPHGEYKDAPRTSVEFTLVAKWVKPFNLKATQ